MLAEFAVRRWQFTLVVFLALAALGVEALRSIPKSEDPTFPFAAFGIVAVLPGAQPKDLERLVVDPLEKELAALEGVKSIKTEIQDGVSVTELEFVAGSDPARKRDDVLRETTALRPTLPAELLRLDVEQFNAAEVNIVELALVSETAPYAELELLANELRRRLEAVPGMGDVVIAGLPPQEVIVELDLERMVALGVSPGEVLAAIGAGSNTVPAGAVEEGARRFNVKTTGEFESVAAIGDTVIRSAGGSSIRLESIARVEKRDSEATQLTRFDGRRAVLVAAAQRDGQNVFTTSAAALRVVDEIAAAAPPGIDVVRAFEQSRNVGHRLAGFARDLGLAILLVLVTLLPLGLRASLVVMVSIPLSLLMGVAALGALGFSINQLSIVGFVIALGLLVDDSVVVVENIARFLREGYGPVEAAIRATKQITVSVLGCTATLVLAFLPLLALPGTAGQFIRSLPVAVVTTILASLVVSLTIVPFLASRLLVSEGEHGNVVFRAMTWVIEASYRRLLNGAIARPRTTLVVAGALFAGSVALIPSIGFSLFPKADTPQFLVSVETPDGTSLEETDRAARFVEQVLARHPEVCRVATSVGKGHPQIYYNVAPENEKANTADVFAQVCTDHFDTERAAALYGALRRELASYAGAELELREFENGPPLDAPIALRLLGDDQAALAAGAALVEDAVRQTPGTRDVGNPARDARTDLRVRVDREKAAQVGVLLPDVDRAVRLAVGGVVAGKYREEASEDALDVRVTLPRAGAATVGGGPRAGLEALDALYVATTTGAPLPLSQIASVELEPSPSTIRHYGKERSVTVTSQVSDGFNTARVTSDVLERLAGLKLPGGVRLTVAGEVESQNESFGGLGAAILVASFGILAVLVLEFQTFRGTIIVASVIPLGLLGGLLALYLSGYTLSFTANIGFVALMGIEVKNSILLVDFTNQLRRMGYGVDQAIQEAGEKRFVPILLTTLTAIGGLVPLVLERSSLYSPLALVILGGLVSSTILTRVVTPVMYKLLAPHVEPDAPSDGAPSDPTAPERPTSAPAAEPPVLDWSPGAAVAAG